MFFDCSASLDFFSLSSIKPFVQLNPSKSYCLIVDSLEAHKLPAVAQLLTELGVRLLLIPGGLTGYIQPVDVGIVSPFKHWLREQWSLVGSSMNDTPLVRRRKLAELIDRGWQSIAEGTVTHSFNSIQSRCPNDIVDDEEVDIGTE